MNVSQDLREDSVKLRLMSVRLIPALMVPPVQTSSIIMNVIVLLDMKERIVKSTSMNVNLEMEQAHVLIMEPALMLSMTLSANARMALRATSVRYEYDIFYLNLIFYNFKINVDECENNECSNNSTCIDGINKYSCQCLPGFRGQFCQTDINECLSEPCVHGICEDGINDYTCTCRKGYSGKRCHVCTQFQDCNLSDGMIETSCFQ